MKKLIVSAFIALGVATAFAEGQKAGGAEPKPEMVRIGGAGKVAFVNVAGVDEGLLKAAAAKISSVLMIEVEVQKGEWSFAEAKKCFADTKANAAVFIVKDSTLPLSLIAMEGKWGVANVAMLEGKSIMKETLRVATVILGGASSKYKASVMRPVFSAADLEKEAGEIITIDALMAIYPNLAALGLKQYEVMEYADALEEGVAPAPVNDAQRKIKAEFEKAKKAKSGK